MARGKGCFVLGNLVSAWFLYVDRLPARGESLAAQRVFSEFGGKGLNLGVGLHRLGSEVAMLLALGNDEVGDSARRMLAAEGMDSRWFQAVDAGTGFGVGFIAPDGSNFLAAHSGANALLSAAQVRAAQEALCQSAWVLAQFEVADEVIAESFRIAAQAGVRTYLNPSPWREITAEILALTQVLVVNEPEAHLLLGLVGQEQGSLDDWCQRLPAWASASGLGGRLLVVTLGGLGSVALDPQGRVHSAPAYAIGQVDATGAGDAFGSGLVFALSRGDGVPAALAYANACGAIIAAGEGILARLPTAVQVAAFMATTQLKAG